MFSSKPSDLESLLAHKNSTNIVCKINNKDKIILSLVLYQTIKLIKYCILAVV